MLRGPWPWCGAYIQPQLDRVNTLQYWDQVPTLCYFKVKKKTQIKTFQVMVKSVCATDMKCHYKSDCWWPKSRYTCVEGKAFDTVFEQSVVGDCNHHTAGSNSVSWKYNDAAALPNCIRKYMTPSRMISVISENGCYLHLRWHHSYWCWSACCDILNIDSKNV